MKKHKKCLLLNQDYTPLEVISWKRALYHAYKGVLRIVDTFDDDFVQSGRDIHPIPAVVVCTKFRKRSKLPPKRTKRNIYLRDDHTCGYCGFRDETGQKLSVDHVIPKSRWHIHGNGGDVNAWTNLITACQRCNINIKRDKLLSECGLKLKKQPKIPSASQIIKGIHANTRIEEKWLPYLPEHYKQKIGAA